MDERTGSTMALSLGMVKEVKTDWPELVEGEEVGSEVEEGGEEVMVDSLEVIHTEEEVGGRICW